MLDLHLLTDRLHVGTQKMPTIAVYKDGKKVAEHVASETGTGSFQKVTDRGPSSVSPGCLRGLVANVII